MSDNATLVHAPSARERVLGLDFFPGSLDGACVRAAKGGLLTAPSGPGLAEDLLREPAYRRALEESDMVLTDSAFMVLLWRLRTGRRLPRNSGLAFLRIWMNRDIMRRPGAVFWVMPSAAERDHTFAWLKDNGYPVVAEDFHVAPTYLSGEIVDRELAALIEARRPAVVYLAIGGGVQERLGHYLRNALSYRPVILCLGAALAFITGAQVRIAPWVDRCGLGWLWRIVSDPSRYFVRYFRALRLAWLVFRFGMESPPLLPGRAQRTT
jgi:UDP-N-acetyl-D-mannosaminuronic acid transferase (WecB/TagA/CpsF family)